MDIWRKGLRSLTNNVKMNNICPMTGLRKHHLKILLSVTSEGKVGVKTIAKTFASGKSEKLVYQILADNGLPNGKGDSMDQDAFTYDIFFKIYQASTKIARNGMILFLSSPGYLPEDRH